MDTKLSIYSLAKKLGRKKIELLQKAFNLQKPAKDIYSLFETSRATLHRWKVALFEKDASGYILKQETKDFIQYHETKGCIKLPDKKSKEPKKPKEPKCRKRGSSAFFE